MVSMTSRGQGRSLSPCSPEHLPGPASQADACPPLSPGLQGSGGAAASALLGCAAPTSELSAQGLGLCPPGPQKPRAQLCPVLPSHCNGPGKAGGRGLEGSPWASPCPKAWCGL